MVLFRRGVVSGGRRLLWGELLSLRRGVLQGMLLMLMLGREDLGRRREDLLRRREDLLLGREDLLLLVRQLCLGLRRRWVRVVVRVLCRVHCSRE